jgi:transposase InsO family protein
VALVVLSKVEQRLDAVRAVLGGARVTEVAAAVGVSRQTLHAWVMRYLLDGVSGLADRSHRPASCPHETPESVRVRVAELRRQHPRWGAKRIRMELLKTPFDGETVPGTATINRILIKLGLVQPRKRKRPKDSYQRWERPGPMQLWQFDIVGGVWLVDPVTGVVREAKVVTGVDDHSRFCVSARVVERATGRQVCLAFAAALVKYGIPDEALTDNGKQFTGRFGRGVGEVLFDKICRHNGITHRLTEPASPTTTGKVERFHLTLRRELLDHLGPFTFVEEAQAVVDAWVEEYNSERPHQALDDRRPVTPADRFRPIPEAERALLPVWLPPTLVAAPTPTAGRDEDAEDDGEADHGSSQPAGSGWAGGPVELDRVVPPSGNMILSGKQFWLGPVRAGQVVRFWISVDLIHLFIGGTRVKTVRSHLSVTDLARLVTQGAQNAGPSPLPPIEPGDAVEVERVVSKDGNISLAGHVLLAAEILRGQRVGIRIEPATLMIYDLDSRELLRTRANPLTFDQVRRLRGNRPAGPPPRPSVEPVRVQRRASNTGVIMLCGQKVALGRTYRHQTLTIHVTETTFAVDLDDGETRVVRRTTTTPIRNIKANRPRPVLSQVV